MTSINFWSAQKTFETAITDTPLLWHSSSKYRRFFLYFSVLITILGYINITQFLTIFLITVQIALGNVVKVLREMPLCNRGL